MSLKAAIIGCGRIAGGLDRTVPEPGGWSATHAGGYRLCPKTDLVAIAEPDEKTRLAFQQRWGVDRAYADWQQMLAEESLDIVSLCLPTSLHHLAFTDVLAAGVPAILLEKPLSHDLNLARQMHAMGQGHLVSVGFMRRWNSTLAELQKDFRAGKYGRFLGAVCRYTKGVIVNGSHHIDFLCWLLGRPDAVRRLAVRVPDPHDPAIDFLLDFGGASAYVLSVPTRDYVFFDADIMTDKGRLSICQRGHYFTFHPSVPDPYFGQFNIIAQQPDMETGWRDWTTSAINELALCLHNGSRQVSCSLDDGLLAAEICAQVLDGVR